MHALKLVRGVWPPPPVAFVSSAPAQPAASPAPVFHFSLLRLRPRHGNGALCAASAQNARRQETKKEDNNWALQMLRVQSRWTDDADAAMASGARGGGRVLEEEDGGGGGERCVGCIGGGGDDKGCPMWRDEELDRAAFSKLLWKVTLSEAKLYSRMSYLCNFAYMVSRIKPKYLHKLNLKFVTSSVHEKEKDQNHDQKQEGKLQHKTLTPPIQSCNYQESASVNNAQPESRKEKQSGQAVTRSAAYQVATYAASYLQSRAMEVLPFGSANGGQGNTTIRAIVDGNHAEGLTAMDATVVAATNSVTSIVAAKEETKQAVADDLNSSRSCPCEWFICDDNTCSTRYFVVQGSETIASWQANLLFEPIKFEGLDVLIHRGIYEVAKGVYQQMLPYVNSYLRTCGKSARLRFTGHSLGGSLALVVNLMVLLRGVAPASSLLPVITFGAPSIMCGGDYLLQKHGLRESHVQSITMHRDIVPRAFSCNYPDHVASILKFVNGNFRMHPCLINQKFLYAPMGKVIILQPDEKFSPHHHLLPSGIGMYFLGDPSLDSETSSRLLQTAMSAFFNSPHPLEILSDSGAYGPKGTVYRDHDVHSYLRSVRAVVRKETTAEHE